MKSNICTKTRRTWPPWWIWRAKPPMKWACSRYLYRQKHMAGNLENVGYAKPGDACLYNVAMMDEMMDVLALGVGAVSKRIVGSQILRRPNPRDIALYIRRIEEICEQKSAFFHG
ncbi:MAG: hypothetical protein ACLT0Y_02050 [Christensenellales bacterium]